MTGRRATTNIIPGDFVLSVGMPNKAPPTGWHWVDLSEVATMATGHTPSRKRPEYWGGEIRWMSVGDARPHHGKVILETAECTNQLGIDNSAAVLLPPGTVCLSRTGSIGYSVILGREMATSQGFVNWICGEAILPRFLQLIFVAENSFLHRISEGVAHTTIYFPEAKAFHVCIPSVDIQARIVAEIEKQFSRLDEAVTNLKRVKANLKRYKAAVLKAAVEGRLVETEAEIARREGRSYETGAQLLQRILETRRSQWQGKGKYKEPAAPDTTDLPELPEGWVWASLDQLSNVVRGGSPRPAGDPRYFGGPVPWITVGPLTANESDYLHRVPEGLTLAGKERSRYIEPDTLLLTNSGATLGVPKISLIGGCINDGVAALLSVEYPLKRYLVNFLRTKTLSMRRINQGAAQPNLNTSIIKATAVPLPPEAEQHCIVAEVDRRFSFVREIEQQVGHNLKRAEFLHQSILAKAFSSNTALLN